MFPTTRWFLVCSASSRSSRDARAALDELVRVYHAPLLALTRRYFPDPEQAQDALQRYLTEKIVQKDLVDKADPAGGTFRGFLCTSLQRFLLSEKKKLRAEKRGGKAVHVDVDEEQPPESKTPEQLFDLAWVKVLRARVLDRIAAKEAEKGLGERFEAVRAWLEEDDDKVPYAELQRRTGLSLVALRVYVSRLKKRQHEMMREEVGETVPHAKDVDAEIRALPGLARGGKPS